jgi:hypothetical protein
MGRFRLTSVPPSPARGLRVLCAMLAFVTRFFPRTRGKA